MQDIKVKVSTGSVFSVVTRSVGTAGIPLPLAAVPCPLVRRGGGGCCGALTPRMSEGTTVPYAIDLIAACSSASLKPSSWTLPRRTRPSMTPWALCRMRLWAWPTFSWNPSPPRLCTAPFLPSTRCQAGPRARSSSCLPNTWPMRRLVEALNSFSIPQHPRASHMHTQQGHPISKKIVPRTTGFKSLFYHLLPGHFLPWAIGLTSLRLSFPICKIIWVTIASIP